MTSLQAHIGTTRVGSTRQFTANSFVQGNLSSRSQTMTTSRPQEQSVSEKTVAMMSDPQWCLFSDTFTEKITDLDLFKMPLVRMSWIIGQLAQIRRIELSAILWASLRVSPLSKLIKGNVGTNQIENLLGGETACLWKVDT